MTHKTFTLIASVFFLVIALGHLSRLVFKVSVLLGGWAVPSWVSWVAALVFAYLALEGFRLAKKSP
jgi:hypothetical protein